MAIFNEETLNDEEAIDDSDEEDDSEAMKLEGWENGLIHLFPSFN